MTPPRRHAQPRHPAHIALQNQENSAPMLHAAAAQAPLQQVQTPTKTAPGHDSIRKHPWGLEVKNTFIHYGSPVKTVSVVTPPKTVPSNFAPEYAFFDKTRTPLLPAHASTPSTVGCVRAATVTGGGPMCPAAGLQPQGTTGTLLRLSDFLPSPGVVVAAPAQLQASNPQAACVDPVSTMPGGWQGFEPLQNLMPPVPPLPGGNLGTGGVQAYTCQAPFSSSFEAPTLSSQLPGQDAVGAVASVGGACCVSVGGTSTSASIAYDCTVLQFPLEGEASPVMSSAGLTCPVAPPPLMPASEAAHPPRMHIGEQVPSFHLGGPCSQPSISGLLGCGGPAASVAGPNSGRAPGQAQEAVNPGTVRRVSICVGHFPEPSVALPPQQHHHPEVLQPKYQQQQPLLQSQLSDTWQRMRSGLGH